MASLPVARPRKIMVDIDSTLYPSDPIFIRAMSEMYGVQLDLSALDHWDWPLQHISSEQFAALISEYFHSDTEILAAVPFRGAVEAINAWRAEGHRVHVVSDRGVRAKPATLTWLNNIGIGYDALVLRLGVDKIEYARRHRIDLVIDDRPDTLERAVEAGFAAATLVYPYNRLVVETHPSILASTNWRDLRRRIERQILGKAPEQAAMATSSGGRILVEAKRLAPRP
jgi:uncharacterized HAD superfamily protein